MTQAPPRHPLLADSLGLALVAMIRTVGDTPVTRDLLERHLQWMIAEEAAGHVLLSGPLAPASRPLHGLTIWRVADLAEAEALAARDPFVEAGVVTFTLHEWTVYEGAIPVTLHISRGAGALA